MTMNERKTIDLEQGWEFMQKGITKLKNILEGLPEPQFSSEDYMMLYTYPLLCYFFFMPVCMHVSWSMFLFGLLLPSFFVIVIVIVLKFLYRTIYNMCTQKPPHDYSQQLYDKYRESFEEYITSTVSNICIKSQSSRTLVWSILYTFAPCLWIGIVLLHNLKS